MPDFDQIIPLRNSFSGKFDRMAAAKGVADPDAIPMWVADMDFRPPQSVLDALQTDLDRGVFGYSGDDAPVRAAICRWMQKMHGWTIEPDWIRFSNGVVNGLKMALQAYTQPGDGVILFSPVYHAFYSALRSFGRVPVESQMRLDADNRYQMDLDTLATQLTGIEKMVILCSPHNPAGRLWSAEEIGALADFCLAHDLLLISDEIHMDLAFPGQRHLCTAVAAPQAAQNLITLTAASKGFNLAGGETGFVIIGDPALREKFTPGFNALRTTPNRFGMQMLQAAFDGGHEWSAEVRAYIADNFAIWKERIDALPGITVMDMPSTYLSWVDFSGTGMSDDETLRRIHEAGVVPDEGDQFGSGSEGFHRFNLALPRPRLMEAIARMEAAFGDLQ